MALSFLSSSSANNPSSVKYFEIRLDQNNLILRGPENDATSALLKGTLVLCLSEPLRVQDIHMRLTGEQRVSWPYSGSRSGYLKNEREFFRESWTFVKPGKRSTEILAAGNYEFPFEKIIPGDTPESVEGLAESWIVYRMKATIERGMLQTNMYARKHVRLIRTFDPTALELAHEMAVENIWPEKLRYSISTPQKAVMFGTSIYTDFTLIPLLKGLTIGRILIELIEAQELSFEAPRENKRRKLSRTVAEDTSQLSDNAEAEEIEGEEGYRFTRAIAIPKSLRKCVQTVEAKGIKIKHSLAFNVQLHNPDGHLSELRATLPVHIFISPNLPLDDNNNLINQDPRTAQTLANIGNCPPPVYGEHHFDQLYSDVDPSGYMTPSGPSGMQTPLYSLSRSGSTEDLVSMDAITANNTTANMLHARLHSLENLNRESQGGSHTSPPDLASSRNASQSSSTQEDQLQHSPNSHPRRDISSHSEENSQPHSQSHTRRGSAEDNAPSGIPQHIEFYTEDLSKVPSYSTALQTPLRTPFGNGLPNYLAAVSVPGNPPPSMPQFPGQVHTAGSPSERPVRITEQQSHIGPDLERRLRSMQEHERR